MTVKKHHFTLIELLVVMGLIGLLVSLAVPTFGRLARGKATPAAADQIKRQLEEAQALAIANRSYVGLIIVNGTDDFNITGDSDDLNESPNQYLLASTRPAFLFKGSNGDYYFEKWAPNSSWSKPIEGARLVEVPSVDAANYDTVIPRDGESKNWSSTMSETTSPYQNTSLKDIDANGTSLPRCAVVFAPDGGLDSESDMFFFITACTVTGNAITYANNNTDYMILHTNRLNGKTVYFSRPNSNAQ